MAFTALLDANVLYPAPLRDLLLQIAVTKLFRARWSDTIHDEWIRAATRARPDTSATKWAALRRLMDAHADDCLVSGFESLIESLSLPDPHDRHVLAAAVKGRADVIVTFNLKHFPDTCLETYDLVAQHPDEFIRQLISHAPNTVATAARTVRARLKHPPRTIDEYLQTLARQGLAESVSELRSRRDML